MFLLESSLESVFASSGVDVEDVASEDDRVGLREFGVRTGVDGRVAAGIAVLHPDGGRVVLGIKRALGDAVTDT